MTRKYETRCWLCGSTDLEPDKRGMRCRSCNATFNVTPKPSQDLLTLKRDFSLGKSGIHRVESSSPSITITRQAKKARGDS